MSFLFGRKKAPFSQCTPEEWKRQWQSLVPPECRDVPITVDGATEIAFVQVNQFVMMLQDGLLMEASFFDVCSLFQKAGYHVIWLMRCTQDIHNGYLRLVSSTEDGSHCKWLWRAPTTNFGRWTSDNFNATILLQHRQIPPEGLTDCGEQILQRVTWAESDDAARMIPGRTRFMSVNTPGSPRELLAWLNGVALNRVKSLNG